MEQPEARSRRRQRAWIARHDPRGTGWLVPTLEFFHVPASPEGPGDLVMNGLLLLQGDR